MTATTPSLYARVMGERFDALPPAVRAMHATPGGHRASGQATVARGAGALARAIAGRFGFPPDGEEIALEVRFTEDQGGEIWERDFAGHRLQSRLEQGGGLLVERFGPFRFSFTLDSAPRGLVMRLRRWTLGSVPLPLLLAPRIEAREWEGGGRFQFGVTITLPLLGPMVHYRGWLEIVA